MCQNPNIVDHPWAPQSGAASGRICLTPRIRVESGGELPQMRTAAARLVGCASAGVYRAIAAYPRHLVQNRPECDEGENMGQGKNMHIT